LDSKIDLANSNILIRCDASFDIGTGHVVRCRTIARALKTRGAQVRFICREQDGDWIKRLSEEFIVIRLPRINSRYNHNDFSGRVLYSQWLGVSEFQDANDCIREIKKNSELHINWLLVDHYGIGQEWHSLIRKNIYTQDNKLRIVVLDDLADRTLEADLLIDSSKIDFLNQFYYKNLTNKSCNQLIGPYYAPLDSNYSRMHKLIKPRYELNRIVIFFGGIDKDNLTSLSINKIRNEHRLNNLHLDVVISQEAPNYGRVKELLSRKQNVTLHSDLNSLASLYSGADLAIGAAGTTSLERACVGLPSIIIPIADNQLFLARSLEKEGCGVLINCKIKESIGDLILETLMNFYENPDLLKLHSELSIQIGDGKGLERIVASIIGPELDVNLRKANQKDKWLYYWWVNDEEVRKQSLNTEIISKEDHSIWFDKAISSPEKIMYVMETSNKMPLGQIRMEKINNFGNQVRINFSLDKIARGYGLSLQLIHLGLLEIKNNWGFKFTAIAEVKWDNEISCNVFRKAGFLEFPSKMNDKAVRLFSYKNT
tara:strand:+ start:393 stop:2018 length:1626 start_codon:yes stop_codon:yes gene_type:complete